MTQEKIFKFHSQCLLRIFSLGFHLHFDFVYGFCFVMQKFKLVRFMHYSPRAAFSCLRAYWRLNRISDLIQD